MFDYSIIIPVYNAEKTLERCLDSVCTQTFTNYEVILIDDGSSDRSLEICKRYKQKNARIRLVKQVNSGPSVARNVGLELAGGKWICFVDSDDSIEENYLQSIQDAVQKYQADVVFIGYNKVFDSGNIEKFLPCEVGDSNIKTILKLSELDMFGYTWIKAFRRESIKDVTFDSSLNLFEDEVFTCQVIPNCMKIGVVGKPIYNYRVGAGNTLIGRTHEDYCLKCDKVYRAWKSMPSIYQEAQQALTKKANSFVSRCYYYAFERNVELHNFFSQLKETAFFKEHTENFELDKAVQNDDYMKLRLAKMKYQIKVNISSVLHGKR